jgi:hypothetical protein
MKQRLDPSRAGAPSPLITPDLASGDLSAAPGSEQAAPHVENGAARRLLASSAAAKH